MDPNSWANAINKVSSPAATSTVTILALLSIFGYLAFKGVPAIMELTIAINHNSDVVTQHEVTQEKNQSQVITNQAMIIQNEGQMIQEHGQMLQNQRREDVEIDDLMADKHARDAHDALKAH